MWIRIRRFDFDAVSLWIQLFTLMRMRIRNLCLNMIRYRVLFLWMPRIAQPDLVSGGVYNSAS
jgi:hypothetical protein